MNCFCNLEKKEWESNHNRDIDVHDISYGSYKCLSCTSLVRVELHFFVQEFSPHGDGHHVNLQSLSVLYLLHRAGLRNDSPNPFLSDSIAYELGIVSLEKALLKLRVY